MCRKEDNMLELVINNVRADGYVTDFTVSSAPKKDSSAFENHDGSTVGGYIGDIITLNITLKKVPTSAAAKISGAVSGKTFPVTYSSPAAVSAQFKKTAYKAVSRGKGLEWDMSLTLESAAPVGGSRL
jgi:hypothetical protein